MTVPAEDFERLCVDAVEAYGDDWAMIEKAVTERLADMPAAKRAAILKAVSEVLSFTPPGPRAGEH
jgi:hypothetical protein